MRATSFMLIACLLPVSGPAMAQTKQQPTPKVKTERHALPADHYRDLIKAELEAMTIDIKTLAHMAATSETVAQVQAEAQELAHQITSHRVHENLYQDIADVVRDVRIEIHGSDPDHWQRPRQERWFQEDPADSLYRAAYSVFSRQHYRQAAERFAQVRAKYPNTRYFCDAAYYEAFSRYRLGTHTDLRAAYRVLEGMGDRCRTGSRRSADVPQLTARVNGALARLGDEEAAERVRRAASEGQNVCDTEDRDVRIQALSALAQMDPARAQPVLRDVLNSRDACSAPIRRQAIQLVARRNDAEAASMLGIVARNDPNRENQLEAVRALGRVSNEAAYRALEAFFRSSADERVKAEAARSLARNEDPRARATVRALVERNDVAERIRVAVIGALAPQEKSIDYWRSLYPKLESEELRNAIVYALAKNESDEAKQFLLSVARNPQEAHATREAALSRVGPTAPISDLYRIFTTADSRSMRLSVVRILAGRRESEATDRLIDIAKSGTDPEVRRAAINALGQAGRKDDPRVIRALGEIISRG